MSLENTKIIKVLSNTHRMAILSILSKTKVDMCVHEISTKVGISQSLASHQLAILVAHDLIEGHRMGQTICYVLSKNNMTQKTLKVLQALN